VPDRKKNEINPIDSAQAKQMRKLIYNPLFCLVFLSAARILPLRIAGNPCHRIVIKLQKKNPPGLRRV
jgi:hypothetical protein